jgi:arylsulfatase
MEMAWIGGDDPGSAITFGELALRERDKVNRPPIIFISIDTLAARHLSLYGYSRETSPNIDRFAESAVTFERCVSNASWTLPSYVSMMTGLYPSAHPPQREERADRKAKGDRWGVWSIPANQWTLAEMLHAAGYRTAGFTDHLFVSKRYRFDQGFERMDTSTDRGIRWIVPKAVQWLESIDIEQPFFLFIHLFNVHGPYRPPEPWKGAFEKDGAYDSDHTANARGMIHAFGSIPEYISEDFVPEGEKPDRLRTAPICSAYDEEILNVDAGLGEFFEMLGERGILDRAMIIINADHGESMIDHHYYFGHGVLYEDVIRVPMIIRMPGAEQGGLRVRQPVQSVDLYFTLRDFLGLDPEASAFHGRSLLPLLRGDDLRVVPTFSETGIMRQVAVEFKGWKLIETYPSQRSFIATMLTHPRVPIDWIREHAPELEGRGLTPERYKQIFTWDIEGTKDPRVRSLKERLKGPFHELYYLPEDRHENQDLAESRPDMVKALLPYLRSYRQLNEKTRQSVTAASEEDAPVMLSESDLEALRQLGYLEGR